MSIWVLIVIMAIIGFSITCEKKIPHTNPIKTEYIRDSDISYMKFTNKRGDTICMVDNATVPCEFFEGGE